MTKRKSQIGSERRRQRREKWSDAYEKPALVELTLLGHEDWVRRWMSAWLIVRYNRKHLLERRLVYVRSMR